MKNYKLLVLVGCLLLLSCEDFVEVENPDYKMVSSEVFNNDDTAQSAMQGIYNQLYQTNFSSGWLGSVSVLAGLSSDNLEPINTNSLELVEFDQHQLLPENTYNYGVWQSAYQVIYMCNSLLEGVERSDALTPEVVTQLEGEAKFVRAFSYFYLVNLYGEVPLVFTTDYRSNAEVQQQSMTTIYEQVIADLTTAKETLGDTYKEGERTAANRYVAMALLARANLYQENWELAEQYSSEVIAQTSLYHLMENLDEVFLANSKEAIWQLSPLGAGMVNTNTNEGAVFIINPFFPSLSYLKLTEGLLASMEVNDKRRIHWTAYHEGIEGHYPYKYKIQNSTETVSEYSMAMRLAEQYLIRAEARAQQNDLAGAIADLDQIKQRAGLNLLSDTQPGIAKEALLEEIQLERRRELFTEWGHRWLDLKRTGKAGEVLSGLGTNWEATDRRYPIPSEERMSNPNLNQNPGY